MNWLKTSFIFPFALFALVQAAAGLTPAKSGGCFTLNGKTFCDGQPPTVPDVPQDPAATGPVLLRCETQQILVVSAGKMDVQPASAVNASWPSFTVDLTRLLVQPEGFRWGLKRAVASSSKTGLDVVLIEPPPPYEVPDIGRIARYSLRVWQADKSADPEFMRYEPDVVASGTCKTLEEGPLPAVWTTGRRPDFVE